MVGTVFGETVGHGLEFFKGGGGEVRGEGSGDVGGFGDDVEVFAEEEEEVFDEDLGVGVGEGEVVHWVDEVFG